MVRQRLAMGGPFGLHVLDPRTALMGTGEIAVEVFKPEGELVGIETLGRRPNWARCSWPPVSSGIYAVCN
jgi:hypothetical protein